MFRSIRMAMILVAATALMASCTKEKVEPVKRPASHKSGNNRVMDADSTNLSGGDPGDPIGPGRP